MQLKDIQEIGSGGYAKVFKSIDLNTNNHYARKVLQKTDQESVKRFQREVRLLSNLDHPNIIKIIDTDLGNTPISYVMPLYQQTLKDLIPTAQGNVGFIKKVMDSVLAGLEFAHSQGVLHRDIKPSNILINGAGDEIVISDFGFGKLLDADSSLMTESGYQMGSEYYMAPEQFTNAKACDHRADLYSIGILLHELYKGEVTPITQDELNLRIWSLVKSLTQKDPLRRIGSVSELKRTWIAITTYSDAEDIKSKAMLLASESLNATQQSTAELLTLLISEDQDPDTPVKALFTAGPQIFQRFSSIDSDKTKYLVDIFVRHLTSQMWNFDYTDTIGEFCQAAYNNLPQEFYESRAALIFCIATVGLKHNRFKLFDIFSDMFLERKDPAELLELCQRFRDLEIRDKSRLVKLLPKKRELNLASLLFPDLVKQEENLDRSWAAMLDELVTTSIPTFSLVSQFAFPVSIVGNKLTIGVLKETFKRTVEGKTVQIQKAWHETNGSYVDVEVVVIST